MATTSATLATMSAALRAAMVPMLTWSSVLAQVGIESTLAGWASTLFSETSAAAVYCGIMKPLFRPLERIRKGGRPREWLSSTRCATRRSEMEPTSAMAMARKSMAQATGSPWKLPPPTTPSRQASRFSSDEASQAR